MKCDLVAGGGRGQQYLLAALRKGKVPSGIAIVDPDLTDSPFLPMLRDEFAANERRIADTLYHPRETTIDNEPATLNRALGDSLGLLRAALTDAERAQTVDHGFFAMPRLGATWLHTFGLDREVRFLNDIELANRERGPIISIHGLQGGTGPVVGEWLLSHVRSGPPTSWRRDLIQIYVLPAFNPELSESSPGVRNIDMPTIRRNAAEGLRNLAAHYETLAQRVRAAGDGAGLPRTVFCIVGPDIERWASRTKPTDAGEDDPISEVLVDVVDGLVSPPSTVLAPASRCEIMVPRLPGVSLSDSTSAPRTTALWSGWPRVLAKDHEQRRWLYSALVLLADLPFHDGLKRWLGIQPVRGFGKLLGDVLVVARQSGRATASRFVDALSAAMEKVARERAPDVAPAVGSLLSVDQVLAVLDSTAATHLRRGLLRAVNLRGASDEQIDAAARRAATALADILTREAPRHIDSRRFSEGQPVTLAPVEAGALDLDAATDHATADANWLRELAESYRPTVNTRCAAVARANPLALADELADLIRADTAEGPPTPNSPLSLVVLLWEAQFLQLLSWKAERKAWLHRYGAVEQLAPRYGAELYGLYYDETLIGFHSPEVGPIPLADVVEEDGAGPKAIFETLDRAVERRCDTRDTLRRVLRAFADDVFPENAPAAVRRQPAWTRLLKRLAAPQPEDTLGKLSLETKPMRLRGRNGLEPIPARWMMSSTTRRQLSSVQAAVQNGSTLVHREQLRVVFTPFPGRSLTVITLDEDDRIQSFDADTLSQAADSVPTVHAPVGV